MMNMKRILLLLGTLLLAGVLAVSLIACDNTPDQPDGTDGETTAAVTDAPTEEPTESLPT